ncbi:MAG: hypothetical protein HY302_03545 [Opitutae bacterium]|nr:hypothetical protein [Opitutae bacterium]
MPAIFPPEADDDFVEALQLYAAIQSELGQLFFRQVNEPQSEVAKTPRSFGSVVHRTPVGISGDRFRMP